jgi:hypothetical protein
VKTVLSEPADALGDVAQESGSDSPAAVARRNHDLDVGMVGLERVRVGGEHRDADNVAVAQSEQVHVLELGRADQRHHGRIAWVVGHDLVPRRDPALEVRVAGRGPDLERHWSGPWNAIVSV